MRKSLRCPCCGSHAVDRGEPIEPDGWYEPFCSTCRKPLTREGLLVDTEQAGSQRLIKEIGKGAEVIWEYSSPRGPKCQPKREDAMRLLAKLAQLEQRAKALGKAVEIKQAYEISWNRKAAARRFRRWFESDYGKQPIEIGDFNLRALANRILNTDAARQPDYDQLYRDMIEDGKYLEEIYAYEERKVSEPALVFRDLPAGTRAALREAQEAYRWGLSRSVVATCRAVLEDVLRQVVTTRRVVGSTIPINKESLAVLINCLPDNILDNTGPEVAHRIREAGNKALHHASDSYAEEPIQVLWITMALVKSLLERLPSLK